MFKNLTTINSLFIFNYLIFVFSKYKNKFMLDTIFLIGMPGMPEILVIVLGVLVLFGGKKIPEFMRGLGKGMREFKDAKDSVKSELEAGMKDSDDK